MKQHLMKIGALALVGGVVYVMYVRYRTISEPFNTHSIPHVDSPKVVADLDRQFREKDLPNPVITRDESGRVNQPEMLGGLQPPLAPLLFVRSSPLCCPTVYTDSRGCKCGDQPPLPVDFTTKRDDGSGNGFR